jgi:PemK-like, MazF-like toxin of type II toxin-antitoxin system
VPYEENPAIGKDRPVVVMSEIRPGVLGVVPLSSKSHAGDPRWLPIGSGAWDPQRRPSSVRLDFVLAVSDSAVRREGSALDRRRFDEVAAALRTRHGWS